MVQRQAEWILEQRMALLLQAGLGTAYLGGRIASRSFVTTVMALAFIVVIVVAGVLAVRHSRPTVWPVSTQSIGSATSR